MSFIDAYDKAALRRAAPATTSGDGGSRNKENNGNLDDGSNTGTRAELVELTEKDRPGGEQPIVTLTNAFNRARSDTGRYSEYAVKLVLKLDKEGVNKGMQLEIRSSVIRRALRSILTGYALMNLAADPIVIKKPYDALFHYREEIKAYATAPERTDEERRHMAVLTEEFYPRYVSPVEKVYREEVLKGRIGFDLLWTLFRAGDDIILHTDYYREVHRVVHGEQKVDSDKNKYFHLQTWRWGYNAGRFGPASEAIIIPEFSSTRRIQQLNCFPVRFLSQNERDALRKELIPRGHLWRTLLRPAHKQYDGPMWVDPPTGHAEKMEKLVVRFTTSRIMLDCQMHNQDNFWLIDRLVGANGYQLSAKHVDDLDGMSYLTARVRRNVRFLFQDDDNDQKVILSNTECIDEGEDYLMTDEQAWLAPGRVRGFSLHNKQFAFFAVSNITSVKFDKDAFQQLEMDAELKKMILALVTMHDQTSDAFDDFVSGKGKGMVMLMEGPPGSGKTLTAESVAELTDRPLYSISTGELSSEADTGESRLRDIFDRATAWRAVLLLDEADLFLCRRTSNDMERNAWVTVFLRLLESYRGILFLTTNRIEEFDPAFASRIHLKVPFESPNAERRAFIWRNLLVGRRGINEKGDNADSPLDACREWNDAVFRRLGRDLDANGREIKNLISTSLAICAFQGQPLSEESLRSVWRVNCGGSRAFASPAIHD